MTDSTSATEAASLAVAIPCYNEAAAIATVIGQFRQALPDAEIVVFDNNSSDGTAEEARAAGARVVPVTSQGKGFVVRAAFDQLAHSQVILLVDGDGTYPAEAAPLMVAPVLEGIADMVVGARQPEPGAGAMSPVRGLGNLLIRSAFRLLIGPGTGDLLSGYRAFSRHFVQAVSLRSEGFEIETELAIEAVSHKLATLEISVPYRPRIAGTESKLRAFRDGRKILWTILSLGLQRNPLRVILIYAATIAVLFAPFNGSRIAVSVELFVLLAGVIGLGMTAMWSRRRRTAARSVR